MPIPVTCPECQYHFLVGDEFAGRPGRCPECAAIIHVPGGEPAPPPADDHRDAYRRPQETEAFDDFPSRLRRRRPRDDDWDRGRGDDYEDGRRDRSEDRVRTFDPHARAAKWEKVARGLRNLTVAIILAALSQAVSAGFDLVAPIQPGQPNQFGSREKALVLGNTLLIVLSMVLWAIGRMGCARVPYVPARRVAVPAAVIAGLTATLGVCAFAAIVTGIFLLIQNPGGPAAALVLLGGCAFVPVLIGFPIAELLGLISQVKMARGLRDPGFARASQVQIVAALLLTALTFLGMCLFLVWFMSETQKAQQKQEEERRQQQIQQGQPPAQKGAPGPAAAKGNPPGRGNRQAQVNNGPGGQQQPPPEVDLGEHPAVVYAMAIGRLLIVLIYAVVSALCFQLGRKAVRREIAGLVGDPHDREPVRDEHY
ncbi:MAG: hypothetical protein J2P46_16380 [Zavarzinella sp.]|nr:hypothetical protein [Zavarzinella sp.]